MKKLSVILCCALVVFGASINKTQLNADASYIKAGETFSDEIPVSAQTSAKSAYLAEADGGEVIFASNENARLTIASMTKIMLLNFVFEAIESGELLFDEDVAVSENAQSMGGSQVFLQANKTYKASDLIKSVIIASANDASVCLAERLFGSESEAVDKMNERSREWGLSNTLFSNVTGLPKPTQYSCAKDVCVMLSNLISHPDYFRYSTVYTDTLVHPDGQETMLTNTNKLVRFYNGCDGGKTGYTDDAGFCLAATAKRGALRVVGVVIGESDSKTRFKDVSALFDHAFSNFTGKVLFDENEYLEERVPVLCGVGDDVKLKVKNTLCAFEKKGSKNEYTVSVDLSDALRAPVKVGETVGTLTVYKDGAEYRSSEIVTAESVEKLDVFKGVRKIAEKWKVG